jgi:hypothetical protein
MSARRTIGKSALAIGFAIVLVRAAAACLDVTPLYVPPREASVLDGAPCLTCLLKPNSDKGCADEIMGCEADSRCKTVYDCMVIDSCLERPVFDDKIACTLPCLTEAGIVSTQDPTVSVLLNIVKCGENGCGTECTLPEGGTGLGF